MDILTELANKNQTDKGTTHGDAHGYTPYYHNILKDRREDVYSVLEIGTWYGCPSLGMWRDYFPNAQIYGIDIVNFGIRKDILPERITTTVLDATDREKCFDFAVKYGPFDLIIDDGSHKNDDQEISLGIFFPYLKSKGLYIIEDLQFCWEQSFINKWINQGFERGEMTMTVPEYERVIYNIYNMTLIDARDDQPGQHRSVVLYKR